jgi:AcrR family transcriptional regulator
LPPRRTASARADDIISAVLEQLDDVGYDGLQIRTVASRARVSLSTIYQLFGSREELIVAAVDRWMKENSYVRATPPHPDESVYEWFVRFNRAFFEPWQRHPKMLHAFLRAQMGPGGERLRTAGAEKFGSIAPDVFQDSDPAFVADLLLIMDHVLHSASAKFVAGQIKIDDVQGALERTLYRFFAGEPRPRQRRSRRES